MTSVARQKCFNHPAREAAARCPECGRFFCRECATEHDGRMICARCLVAKDTGAKKDRPLRRAAATAIQLAAGFLFTWLVFYAAGRSLLQVPSAFHEGTLWKKLPAVFDVNSDFYGD